MMTDLFGIPFRSHDGSNQILVSGSHHKINVLSGTDHTMYIDGMSTNEQGLDSLLLNQTTHEEITLLKFLHTSDTNDVLLEIQLRKLFALYGSH